MFARLFAFPGYIISCIDQHVDFKKATWSHNYIQNKYSYDPVGRHEFTASYLYYLMEDHLTSKQNRDCFTLDIFFKTRLDVSTKIRDKEY